MPPSGSPTTARRRPVPLESAAFGLLRFAGGRSIQLEAAWILPEGDDRQYVHLHGTAAGALVERDRLTVIRVGEAGTEAFSTPIVLGAPDASVAPFQTQASHFAAAIRGTAPALAPAEDGVQLMQMVDALYASASERREVGLLENRRRAAQLTVLIGRPC